MTVPSGSARRPGALFTLLVITGFMLRYPRRVGPAIRRINPGAGIFTLRSQIHRISAVVMVAASAYHASICSSPSAAGSASDLWWRERTCGTRSRRSSTTRPVRREAIHRFRTSRRAVLGALQSRSSWPRPGSSRGSTTRSSGSWKAGYDVSRTIHFWKPGSPRWRSSSGISICVFNPTSIPKHVLVERPADREEMEKAPAGARTDPRGQFGKPRQER